MDDKELKRKAELYFKLGGTLYHHRSINCFKCVLNNQCHKPLTRRFFLQGPGTYAHWKIVGFGQDFGVNGKVEIANGVPIHTISVCVEWLDPDPRTGLDISY